MSGTGATTIGSSGVLAIGNAGVTLGRTLNNGGTTMAGVVWKFEQDEARGGVVYFLFGVVA